MIQSSGGGVLIDVRVVPRAGRSGVAGTRDGALLVRVNAPPLERAANAELIEVIAKALGVPKRAVSLVSGERSRQKRLQVSGLSREMARAKLLPEGAEWSEETDSQEPRRSGGRTELFKRRTR